MPDYLKISRLFLALSVLVSVGVFAQSSSPASAFSVIQLNTQRDTNPMPSVEDTNDCEPFTANNTSAIATDDVLKTVSGVVSSSSGPLANTLVTSLFVADGQFKVSCVVTGINGTYSLQVLKSGSTADEGEIVFSPPVTSEQSALLTGQLGSTHARITGTTNESKNVLLVAANSYSSSTMFYGASALDVDNISAPFVQRTIEFDPTPSSPKDGYVTAVSGIERGTRISASISKIEGLVRPRVSGDAFSGQKVLRVTFSGGNPGFFVSPSSTPKRIWNSFEISGISNISSTSNDESLLNSRWASAIVVDESDGNFQLDLMSPRVQTFSEREVSGVTAVSNIWRSFLTVPEKIEYDGSQYDLTGLDSDSATVPATDLRLVKKSRTSDGNAVRSYSRIDDQFSCQWYSDSECTEFRAVTTESTTSQWGLLNRTSTGIYLNAVEENRITCSTASSGVLVASLVTDISSLTPAGCGSVFLNFYNPTGGYWDQRSRQVSHFAQTGTTATFTTTSSHPYSVGDSVSVWGISPSYQLFSVVTSVPDSTTFTLNAFTSAEISRVAVNRQAQFSFVGGIDSSGLMGINLPNGSSQILNLRYSPRSGQSSIATQIVIRATVVSGDLTEIEQCSTFNLSTGNCTSTWAAVPMSEGRPVFLVSLANFVGKLISPENSETPGAVVNYGNINLQKLQDSGSGFSFVYTGDYASSDTEGIFRTKLSAGYYRIKATSPYNASYPEVEALLRVTGENNSITIERCSTFSPSAPTIDTALSGCTSTNASASNPFVMQYPSADLSGFIFLENGATTASNSWISVEKASSTIPGGWEQITGVNSNSSGQYSLAFATAGTYRLFVNPPYNNQTGATRTMYTVVVTVSGSTKTVTVNGDSDGQVNLVLSGSNFLGKILASSETGSAFGNAGFEQFQDSSQQFVWQSVWGNANSSGDFGVNLTAGRWRITARPGSSEIGQYSNAVFYAYVITSGTPSIYLNTRAICAVSAPISACSSTAISASSGRFPLLLNSANVVGYALKSSSSARNSNGSAVTGSDAVAHGWIEVQQYNASSQTYQWSADVQGSNTDASGRFGLRLPEGRYRLNIYPQPTDTANGRSRKSFDITVASDGSVTCDSTYSFCASGSSPASGRFDLHFGATNLGGTVTAGGTAVGFAQVRAERWNGSNYGWPYLWANSTAEGRYGFNIETNGVYRITAEFPSSRTNTGFSPASTFIFKSATAICAISESSIDSTTSCPSGSSSELTTASIALAGANIRGLVKTASNETVQYGHVNVFRFVPSFNNWQWTQGLPVAADGTFNATFRSSLGETKNTAQRFRIEISPPYNNTTLTRKNIEFWVGDLLDNNASNHSYVICSATRISGCNFGVDNANVKTQNDILNVTMFGGNLTGSVRNPNDGEVANPWINMELWTAPSGSRNSYWVWTNTGASGSTAGVYAIDTSNDCPTSVASCFFRVSANPGWINTDNWTKQRKLIEVRTSDGAWRLATQNNNDEPVGTDSFSNSPLNFTLIGSNVSGTLKSGDVLVPNAWIGLLKERTGYYEWLGGTHTGGTGQFGLATSSHGAGRYRLEVNPPQNSSYAKFSKDIVVAANGTYTTCSTLTEATASCAGSSSLFTLSFPTPNIQIRVCDKDSSSTNCTAVGNSWINILDLDGNRWLPGMHTQSNGLARFNLDDGTYRGSVNPPNSNAYGARVEFDFTISGGILTSPTTATTPIIAVDQSATPRRIDVKLASPNILGTVKYVRDADVSITPENMSYASISVRNATTGQYVQGGSSGPDGDFQLILPAGNFVLTAHANSGVAQRQPVSVELTVASNGSVTRTGGGSWDGVLNFDAISPNVSFSLIDVGVTARQIFVLKRADSGDYENYLIAAITPTSGDSEIDLFLAAGSYKFRIQKSSGDFSSGESCRESDVVTVTGDSLSTSGTAAINAWRVGFDATGDDLECK